MFDYFPKVFIYIYEMRFYQNFMKQNMKVDLHMISTVKNP
jgi:hypothetical protein